jgi:large subunit ribosomal protein L7Ae
MTEEDKVYDAVELASNTGRVKRGVNETTKAVEREKAKVVVIAKDVSPEAITMHLPVLCEEKKIPCVYVPSRKELGEASGIGVPVSALAVTEEGDAKKLLETLRKAHVIEAPKPAEAPKEEKPEAPKEEKPKEAPKKEEKAEAPKEAPKKEKPKEGKPPKEEKAKKAPKKAKPKKKPAKKK